jgi:hypothetical protein
MSCNNPPASRRVRRQPCCVVPWESSRNHSCRD